MRRNPLSKIDFILLSIVILLSIAGLLALYSATNTTQSQGYFLRQVMVLTIGFSLLFVTTFTPLKIILRLSYLFYGISIFLLVLVFFFGVIGYGAERWLYLGPVKLQPSEPAKIATVLAVARYLSRPEVDINRFKHLAVVLGFILVPFLLIARQPDLGTSLVFLAMIIPVLFWAGLNWFALFVLIAPLITAIVAFNAVAFTIWMILIMVILFFSGRKILVLATIFILHVFVGIATPKMWDQLRPYQKQRILTFANPEQDPRGSGYQIIQSKVAIGSGGLWGKGFLKGSQTQLRFLPAQHTDFIFSVIGEEWGFMGVATIMALFFLLLVYLLYLATVVKSPFSSISLIGIMVILFFHIFVNIGMTVGLAPVTGLPLPFISYGGSFLLTTLFMIGLAMNFSANRLKK
ncbi:MAG TPA: rod shape-determining protein RodA [Caldithrix abyssi]|uniref:Peptidoglycan glycosyltransferase RodA n=1 Tax=Caldithrix abyssi TaxID=187145 RepID=A0A7V5PMQ8_CALAY|nr:rod shape-determining protein RodA [Caldithrix abyssi]